ncbi:hypothetical protein GCM10007886_39530 [Methylobacterium gregans]|uniref:Uncharacterized protein n=1 Tax=Methylobacterium gregans TaxID=374424 RepID=A0AA37HKC2_9HYPH|nr:hypothetical protein [Methylobacterium gregans]GJD77170.1 hypothetical protein NBEOAGPD_0373 [Methylobacterium gregans]GLS55768.1 hypothetical protein GCM10007886_39530 [Methylobacterium gregans]
MAEPCSGNGTEIQRRSRTPYSAGYRSETASERARHAVLNRFSYSGGFDGYEGRMTCPPSWRTSAFRDDQDRGARSAARDGSRNG